MWAARRAVVAVRGAARTVGITRFQHSQAAPKAVYQNKLRVSWIKECRRSLKGQQRQEQPKKAYLLHVD